MAELTLAHLKCLLKYDPDTGAWTRLVNRAGAKAGIRAEAPMLNGYRQVVVDRRHYLAHRLAWFYTHGVWPAGDIDHIDRNRSNNSLKNLRVVTRGQNITRAVRKIGKSGLRGAQRRGNRWRGVIGFDGENVHLGYFDTKELAHEAYLTAAKKLFGECAYSGREVAHGR